MTPAAHEHGWLSTGSETNLDAVDAAELAEMLQFLSQWLASEPARLGASLGEVRRPPAYGLPQLRQDLERFVFLLGGSDGKPQADDGVSTTS